MSEALVDIVNNLVEVKKYLIKCGKKRYSSKAAQEKYELAKKLYNNYQETYDQYLQEGNIPDTIVKLANTITSLIVEIKDLMIERTMSKPDFDLKVAVSVLPVMDNSEKVTLQLIDAIELYSTMISSDSIPTLIQFVLKTRLSNSAKLRLNSTYNSAQDLVTEMKKNFLVTKSGAALQKKLLTCYQGNRTIDQFGTELEQLFVNLTLTQANENKDAYTILKPLNEKLATHKFADGLRNEKLRTILAARNYSSLKEAIQGAKDEEISMSSSSSGQIFSARGRPYRRGFQNHRGQRFQNKYQNNYSENRQNYSKNNSFYTRGKRQGNFTRGRGNTNGFNKPYNHQNRNQNHHVNVTFDSHDTTGSQKKEDEMLIPKQFFRDN